MKLTRKRRKQLEAVIFDLELISDSNLCYHCSLPPPPCKKIFSLVHPPVKNMVLGAIVQLLLPLMSLELLFNDYLELYKIPDIC